MIQTTPIISRARVYKTPTNTINITQSSGSDSGLKHSHPESWYTSSSQENKSSPGNSSYSSGDETSHSAAINPRIQQQKTSGKIGRKFQSWKQKITGNTPKKVQPTKNSIKNGVNTRQEGYQAGFNTRQEGTLNIFSQKRSARIDYIDSSATSSMTSVYDQQKNHHNNPDMKEYHEVDIPVGTFGNLGITVIGQTTPDGHDVGIYCGGIVPKSAAASLGRLVEVGDRLVMVDGEDLRHMPNDYAVEVLQQRVTNCLLGRSGRPTITCGLAKYMDQNSSRTSSESSDSATEILDSSNEECNYGMVKPINPAEWVANHEDFYLSQSQLHKTHLQKVQKSHQNHLHGRTNSELDTNDSNSVGSDDILTVSEERESTFDTLCYDPQVASHKKLLNSLSIQTSMRTMVKTACERNSGLKIKDREWFKLLISNAVLGADLVDWLHDNVTGLEDRRDAKQYAATLFKGQLVKPTIQAKLDKFSEKSYYKF